MPSTTRAGSSPGSKSRFVDRERVLAGLRRSARRAAERVPELERVLLFGSFARGTAGARSDADLVVVLSTSRHRRRMDRIPELLEALYPAPVPLDVVPWTAAEVAEARARHDPFWRMSDSDAEHLWPHP